MFYIRKNSAKENSADLYVVYDFLYSVYAKYSGGKPKYQESLDQIVQLLEDLETDDADEITLINL